MPKYVQIVRSNIAGNRPGPTVGPNNRAVGVGELFVNMANGQLGYMDA